MSTWVTGWEEDGWATRSPTLFHSSAGKTRRTEHITSQINKTGALRPNPKVSYSTDFLSDLFSLGNRRISNHDLNF